MLVRQRAMDIALEAISAGDPGGVQDQRAGGGVRRVQEKRAVGALWEGRSEGRCLFVMPEGKDLEAIRRKISRKQP